MYAFYVIPSLRLTVSIVTFATQICRRKINHY